MESGKGLSALELKSRRLMYAGDSLNRGRPSMSVFEKLSRSARKAVNTAFDEARHLGHNFVGMEHILLGIVRVPDNLVSKRLLESGIRIEDIRLEVIKLTGQSVFQTNVDGYTPRARHCLEQKCHDLQTFGVFSN